MDFLENYIDQRALDYALLRSPIPPVIFIFTYLSAIYFGPQLMKSREPYNLKSVIAIYNILQVLLCIITIKLIFDGGYTWNFFWKCHETDYSRSIQAMKMLNAAYLTHLTKGFEFIETIFFILRKKNNQVSNLHVYHHVSTFLFSWFFARSVGGSMIIFSLVLNSIVHIVMYSYYFITLFGPNVQKRLLWFKKSITSIQIIQFLLIIANQLLAAFSTCAVSRLFIMFFTPNVAFLLYLFGNFYRSNYLKTKKNA